MRRMPQGPAGLRIEIDQAAVQTHVLVGHVEMRRPMGQRRLHHAIDPPPKDALVRTGHAHVALKGRAAGQDLLVGGGHVGVRAQAPR